MLKQTWLHLLPCLLSFQPRSPAPVDSAKRVKLQAAGSEVLVKLEMKKQVGRHRTAISGRKLV